MRHAGIRVPRQYAAFAGTAYGRRVNALFDLLVERRYATICGCVHNRARLDHVRPLVWRCRFEWRTGQGTGPTFPADNESARGPRPICTMGW